MIVTPPSPVDCDPTWVDLVRWYRSAFLCGAIPGFAPEPAERFWN